MNNTIKKKQTKHNAHMYVQVTTPTISSVDKDMCLSHCPLSVVWPNCRVRLILCV